MRLPAKNLPQQSGRKALDGSQAGLQRDAQGSDLRETRFEFRREDALTSERG